MPDGVCTAWQGPALIDTLGADGDADAELAAIMHGNGRGLLAAAWHRG